MTKTIQLLRGTTVQNDAFTGATGEVTVDTQTHELRVHDGSTVGGFTIPKKSDVQSLLGGGTAGTLLTNSGTPGTVNSTSIDATPTDGSNNPVSSNGVYDVLVGKANTDLSNLTDIGKNIANWSNNVTNCITEIPQDIKLELNNGTLTLKAGSKVYVPNGAGVFDTVTIASDLTTTSSTDGVMFVFIRQDGTLLFGEYNQESGTSTPTNQWTTYYNTNDNKVYRYTTSTTTPSYQASFPIAKIKVSNGAISSIDQVFNGFGYIGSTVFALPGVKGLAPNKFNSDGSLKSKLISIDSVKIMTFPANFSNKKINYGLTVDNTIDIQFFTYLEEQNLLITSNGNITSECVFATSDVNNGKISSFTAKQVFHAVDYSDKEFIANQAMPSNKWVDVTLGATGATYTAPADGYFTYQDVASGVGMASLANWTNGLVSGINAPAATWARRVFLPVKKGDVVELIYQNGGTSQVLRFIYAQGAA